MDWDMEKRNMETDGACSVLLENNNATTPHLLTISGSRRIGQVSIRKENTSIPQQAGPELSNNWMLGPVGNGEQPLGACTTYLSMCILFRFPFSLPLFSPSRALFVPASLVVSGSDPLGSSVQPALRERLQGW